MTKQAFLIAAVFFAYFVGLGFASCDEFTCQLGGQCVLDAASNERKCVCPEFPCTPELGADTMACGDDDVTYKSVCALRQSMCKQQKWIDLKHPGPCGEQTCIDTHDCLYGGRCIRGKCKCIACRDVVDRRVYYGGSTDTVHTSGAWKRTPVCGHDGVTYPSMCHLNYHACMAKTYVYVEREGVCRHERRFLARSARNFKPIHIVERPASLKSPSTINCSTVEFVHCESRRHPRYSYLGEYARVEGRKSFGSPVYQLVQKHGSANDETENAYLSRHVTELRPKGIWIVGSAVGTGKGWLAVADPSPVPEKITKRWQYASLKGKWKNEPGLSMRCRHKEEYECLESVRFDNERDSNWNSDVIPPSPLYALKIIRPTKEKYKKRGKIIVELRAKMQWRKFRAYIIKLTNDRPSCGVPKLVGKKNLSRHVQKCEGTVIINKSRKKKMLKAKFRFKAPVYGCVTISASVLSATGFVYEDDILTKTICSKKS